MKEKTIMYVFKKKCFKDNNKPAHWVGHSKLISPKIDEFFQRTFFFEDIHNGFFFHHDSFNLPTRVYYSVSKMSNQKIIDLLQLVVSSFQSPLLVFKTQFSFL